MSRTQENISGPSGAEANFPGYGFDSSGYQVFSDGAGGHAHVVAHAMLDRDDAETGRALLGELLAKGAGREGSACQYVHLQWHMAVFELMTGDWRASYARFRRHILPRAAAGGDALTDAPALLWRLALTAPHGTRLPWEPLRKTALARMAPANGPWVEIHNLLAVAGAGDYHSLNAWLESRASGRNPADEVVVLAARALRAYVAGDYAYATDAMSDAAPRIAAIDGSRAQNTLFTDIAADAWRRAASVVRH